jgi:cysteine-S-conjugate beta-lyase
MSYDFDALIDRKGSGCYKYDALKMLFGREDLLPLWVADMDFCVAPEISEAMRKRLEHGVFGYNLHLPKFYETAVQWISDQYGFQTQRDWILNSPGIMPAISLAVMQLTAPGDGVVIQTPVYRPFFDAVLSHGRKLLTNPLIRSDEGYLIDLDDLGQKLSRAKLFIICSPHNPVGRVWTEQELLDVGRLCRKHGVTIISDEIHADLVYGGRKAVSIASLEDFADISMCCYSPAKSFNLAGLTSSVIVIKNDMLRKPVSDMIFKLHLYIGNSFGIAALQAAWTEGSGWLNELLKYLWENFEYLKDTIEKRFEGIRIIKPGGTYLAWLDFLAWGMSDEELNSFLINEAKLALEPGLRFGEEGSGFARLNFACPRSRLEQALEQLHSAWQRKFL